jgi:DNA-binding SARP family transcriptional activator
MASRGTYGKFFSQLSQELLDQSSAKVTPPTTREVPPRLSAIVVPRIEVSALGLLRISLDGKPIPAFAWGSAKAREMFLFMLYKRQPLHKEKIVEALWPEISSSKANSNFHSTRYRMRAALYPNCIDRDGETYQLNPAWSYWFDANQFQGLLAQATQLTEDGPEKESILTNAIDLYRGPFLEDLDSEWCRACRTEWEAKFLQAVSSLARRHEERREFSQSLALLEKALVVDELQEDLHYRVMDLCLKQGDSGAANRAYRRCLSVFGEVTTLSRAPEVGRLLARLN